jgi:hypothetical protein
MKFNRIVSGVGAVVASVVTLLLLAPLAGAGTRYFGGSSIWNQQVPATAPQDPNAPAIMGNFLQQEATEGLGISTTSFGVPIYNVGSSQKMVRVKLDQGSSSSPLQTAFNLVPLPLAARQANGTDANLAVYQASTDTMWEFWRLSLQSDGWHAAWGGKMSQVTTNPGYYRNVKDPFGNILEQPNWGTTAASFPLVAGVLTIEELQSGSINHAIGLAISHTCAGYWAAPAQRTDGDSLDPTCVPEGAHFRLDPKLNLASLNLPHFTYMLAQAAQKYGIIINNRSSGFTIRGEDPYQFQLAHGYNPYTGPQSKPGSPGALYDKWPSEILRAFPWSHLQLLPMTPSTSANLTQIIQAAPPAPQAAR